MSVTHDSNDVSSLETELNRNICL